MAGQVRGRELDPRHGRPAVHRPARRAGVLRARRGARRPPGGGGGGVRRGHVRGRGRDFIWRLAAAGWRVGYEPSATMGHDHRVEVPALVLPPCRLRHLRRPGRQLRRRGPPALRLLVDRRRVGGGAVRPPGHRRRPHRRRHRPARRRLSTVTGETWPSPPPPPPPPDPNRHRDPRPDNSKKSGADPPAPARQAEAWRLAARLAGGGTIAAARPIGSALSRTWWPLAIPAAIAFPRLRRPVAALILLPPLLDWADRRPPLDPARYVAARLLDDAAYSLGVWHGCIKRRAVAPLLPAIGGKRPPNVGA